MKQSQKESTQKNLSKIKNIVVVMFENHSFDNMLGWLYENRNPPRKQAYEGLHKSMWNPLNNIDADGVPFIEKVPIHKNGVSTWKYGKETKHPVDYTLPNPDPGEGFKDTNHQLFEKYNVASLYPPPPTNMGFVNNYNNAMLYGTFSFGDTPTDPRKIMTTYTTRQLPVLTKLARNYAVCDQWFCSVPSQTLPNRDFIHAATSTGYVNNSPQSACDARTIYNQIQDAIDKDGRKDLSWKVYGSNPLTKSEDDSGKVENGDFYSLTRVIMTQLHDTKLDDNFQTLDTFFDDCKNGSLPRYSFIEPVFGGEEQNDQHPPSDVRAGEQFMADIYNSVVDSKQWEETLLVITYDEHGGCFDHVAPPEATPPRADKAPGQDGFRFNRFGVRVPTVLISPYIQANTVCRPEGYVPFDHTSVIATARELFGLGESLTERDKKAPTLDIALNLDKPRKDKVKLYPLGYKKKDAGKNDLHKLMEKRMKELTGEENDHGDTMKYLHDTYKKHFYPKKRSKKSPKVGSVPKAPAAPKAKAAPKVTAVPKTKATPKKGKATKTATKGMNALNEEGKPTDWWFIYKTPDNVGRKGNKGYDYFYYDDNSTDIILSKNTLDQKKGALDATLNATFNSGDKDQGYIVYNDEQTDQESNDGSNGHTKGVLVFNKKKDTGLILLHSTPRFPAKGEITLPKDEAIYGQTYLCITLKDFKTLEDLASQMMQQQNPQILTEDCYIPADFDKKSPLNLLFGGKNVKESKDPSTVEFTSAAGKKFKLIAKSKKWGKDFWVDLVSPELGVDLNVETWRRGTVAESVDTKVSKEETDDIMQIDFGPIGFKGYAWKYTKDHAKWGAATKADSKKGAWVCIADMNRMKSQEKRGGGSICFEEPNLWKALNGIEATVQKQK